MTFYTVKIHIYMTEKIKLKSEFLLTDEEMIVMSPEMESSVKCSVED